MSKLFNDLVDCYYSNDYVTFKEIALDNPNILNEHRARGESLLYTAVRCRIVKWTKLMLELGASPTFSNSIGELPLAEALRNDDLKIVKLLVEAGADVNKINDTAVYPNPDEIEGLYITIHHDEVEMTNYLIKHNAKIFNYRSIINAISSYEMVKLLEENLYVFSEEGLEYWENQKLKLLLIEPKTEGGI